MRTPTVAAAAAASSAGGRPGPGAAEPPSPPPAEERARYPKRLRRRTTPPETAEAKPATPAADPAAKPAGASRSTPTPPPAAAPAAAPPAARRARRRRPSRRAAAGRVGDPGRTPFRTAPAASRFVAALIPGLSGVSPEPAPGIAPDLPRADRPLHATAAKRSRSRAASRRKSNSTRPSSALALLSGALLALSFPKFGHPAFAWLALDAAHHRRRPCRSLAAPLVLARARRRRRLLLGHALLARSKR